MVQIFLSIVSLQRKIFLYSFDLDDYRVGLSVYLSIIHSFELNMVYYETLKLNAHIFFLYSSNGNN